MSEIKRLRNSVGLSQRKLAERLGVTPGAVSKMESGKMMLRQMHIYAVRGVIAEERARLKQGEGNAKRN